MPIYDLEVPIHGKIRVVLDRSMAGDALRDALLEKITRGEFARSEGEPSVATRISQGIARPLKRGIEALVQGGGMAGEAEGLQAQAMAHLVGGVPPPSMPSMTTEPGPVAKGIASIIPETPSGQLGMAGTIAGSFAGPLAPVARPALAGLGGAIGGWLEGGSPLIGAMEQGGPALVGEGGAALFRFGRAAIPGGRTTTNLKDMRGIVDSMEPYLPGVASARSPSELLRIVRSGDPLNAAGTTYTRSVAETSKIIGHQRLTIPALSEPGPSASVLAKMLTNHGFGTTPIQASMAVNLPTEAATILGSQSVTAAEGGRRLAAGGYGRAKLTLEEAVDRLKKFGYQGFSGSKELRVERTYAGRPEREVWEEAMGQIERELTRYNPTGEAVAAFREGRRGYSLAAAFNDMLKRRGTYLGNPNEVRLDMNALRQLYEYKYGKLRGALSLPELEALELSLYRGGPIGSRDLVGRGPDSLKMAAAQLVRTGGGSGTLGLSPVRTLLPGGGDLLTGRHPMALSPQSVTAIDLLAQRLYGAPSTTAE